MPRVLILPHHHHESALGDLCSHANEVQTDFKFHLLPPDQNPNSPLLKSSIDYPVALRYLDDEKSKMHREVTDLLVSLYDGTLEARKEGFTNLFLAGANSTDPFPCNAIVSLQFIGWGILSERFNYDLQNHALFHLVVCALIGSYTSVEAHPESYGCLLDFNNQLPEFNRKLLMGYYLCSDRQRGCHSRVLKQRYGAAIVRLCESLRTGINKRQLQLVIKELEIVTGDKFENIGAGATIISRSTLKGASVNVRQMVGTDAADALEAIGQHVEGSKNAAAGALFNSFNTELQKPQPDKSILRQCWDGLVAVLPSVATLAEAASKISKLFA